jgi:glycosyltransferase involved in cell wall biosynthesis
VLFRGETSDLPQSGHALVTAAKDVALRLAYRTCARVLYIGTRSRRHFERAGVDPGRLCFSPYCVDTRAFTMDEAGRDRPRQGGRARMGIGPGDVVLAFVGKVSERKGADLIVGAIRKLPDALRARVVLVLAGDGELGAPLAMEAARAPALAIRSLGVLPQTALSEVYHLADLLLLPSRAAETWGLVVNEAMHHGLPCVVSARVGCAPDLISRETGVVMTGHDETALADAVVAGLHLAGRRETREACRARVAGFSIERAADGIVEAYRAVVPEAPEL